MPDLNSVHLCAGAWARGGHRLEEQVQKSVIKCSSTSLCLADKNKRLRPLSLSLCMSGEP